MRFFLGFTLFFFPLYLFASSPLSFPMTTYGTLKVGTADLGIGAILTFSDGSGNILNTYTTTRIGWYGFDSSIMGVSPTFSQYGGALRVSIQYGGKNYTVSSINSMTSACPPTDAIIFISDVCRYDIVLTAPVAPPPAVGGGSVGGGSYTPPPPPQPVAPPPSTLITQTGASLTTLVGNNPVYLSKRDIQLGTGMIVDLKKKKLVILHTPLKRGERPYIYRVLSNGRLVRSGIIRVTKNGLVRFTPRISGRYILK